jgi:hypothetical protein
LPLLLLGAALLGMLLPPGRQFVMDLLNSPAVQAAVGEETAGALVGYVARVRIANPWTYLTVALLVAWAIGVLRALLAPRQQSQAQEALGTWHAPLQAETRGSLDESDPPAVAPDGAGGGSGRPAADAFAVLMIALALALTLMVEFAYLRDLFGTRMNTVFKLYYQSWALLALASGFGLSRLAERGTAPWLKIPALAGATLLIVGALVYPVLAIPSKADNFRGDPTLDGLQYIRRFNPADMAAIEWLRDNAQPDAVVVEASGGSYSAEGAGRVSMSTGNPTLLGWDFHERQWRGKAYDELVAGRPEALDRIYRTATPEELPALLAEWAADYVYVGALERSRFGIEEPQMARFERALKRVYDQDGVRIYAR